MIRGDRLRQLRESAGYSREKLASAINISAIQLARYEYDQSDPSSDVISRLATFFNVSADYLLGRTDLPTPTFDDTTLSDKELAIIAALRQGERMKALEIIITDREAQPA